MGHGSCFQRLPALTDKLFSPFPLCEATTEPGASVCLKNRPIGPQIASVQRRDRSQFSSPLIPIVAEEAEWWDRVGEETE